MFAVNFKHNGTIGRVTPDARPQVWVTLPTGSEGCGMVFGPDGRLYVADWKLHRILAFDRTTREWRVHAVEPRMNQPNDLAVSTDGTLFASDPDWESETGQLWRIGTDGSTTLLESGMGTTNGIELSPDERTLYVNESVQRRIWAYDLDAKLTPVRKRLLAEFDDFLLDGMRCDLDGTLYVTRTGAGLVAVVRPDGRVDGEIQLIGRDCTNVGFGGPDGQSLYITVADSGSIEHVRVSIPGRSHLMWERLLSPG